MAKKQSFLVYKVVLKFTSGDYGLGLYLILLHIIQFFHG